MEAVQLPARVDGREPGDRGTAQHHAEPSRSPSLDEPLRGRQGQYPPIPGSGRYGRPECRRRLHGAWLASGRVRVDAGEGQEALYFPLQASLHSFSLVHEVAVGAFMQGERLVLRREGQPDAHICDSAGMRLRGRHNRANMLAAVALASAAGAGPAEMAAVATTFTGVEHRLEIVRQRNGVLWINDSIATAPERTVAAITSFDEPLVLLLGGRDKHLPWDECAAPGASQPSAESHPLRRGGRTDCGGTQPICGQENVEPVAIARVADLENAVAEAARCAEPGCGSAGARGHVLRSVC